jgi:hypothetical protein
MKYNSFFRCIHWLFILTFALAGCTTAPDPPASLSGSQPKDSSTSKPPIPTATSIPVQATRTIQPTRAFPPTATPKATATPEKFKDGKLLMPEEDFNYLLEGVFADHYEGNYLRELATLNAMLEYSQATNQLALIYDVRGTCYESLGQYDLAIEDYLRTLDLGFRSSDTLNSVCWIYGITKRAEEALPFCEEAVKVESSSRNLDSRAVVYALLSRYTDALSDFETALEKGDYPSEEMTAQRRDWVEILKTGTNPITEDVLKQEVLEEAPIEYVPYYSSELTLSYLRQQYEEYGYSFSETTVAGQTGLKGISTNDYVRSEIVILLDSGQVRSATFTMETFYDNIDIMNRVVDFTYGFTRDHQEAASAFVWSDVDYYDVVKGEKPVADLSPIFGGFQFTVEKGTVDGNPVIIVTATPAE